MTVQPVLVGEALLRVEGFLAGLLQDRASATFQSDTLKTSGYDVQSLAEILAHYSALPSRSQRFYVLLVRQGEAGEFTLCIEQTGRRGAEG